MDILVTRHLTLRPPLDVDAEAITQALQNTSVTRMLTRVPNPYNLGDAKSWIEERQSKPDEVCFTIYRQKLMGVVSVEEKDGMPDLGYWLTEESWNKGYMSEAARAVLSHAFRTRGYSSISSGAFEDNHGSLRVLEKLGFRFDGVEQHYSQTRQCEVSCKRAVLTRENFERQFGAIETNVAA